MLVSHYCNFAVEMYMFVSNLALENEKINKIFYFIKNQSSNLIFLPKIMI